jgi:hypothetical protein
MVETMSSNATGKPDAAHRRRHERIVEYICIALILIGASVLILSNLGNIYMYGDEAQNALLAKTTLAHGIPLAYDGRNYFSNQPGECTASYLWTWQPWFPYYLLAGFFAVFGTSTFTARLPYALAGIGAILLTYFYGKSLWHSRRAALIAALLLMLSVPFLLLVRQCRYYSLTALFSLASLYAYSEMLNGRKRAPVVFGLSALLLFHTHYTYTAALLGTAIIHSLIFRRDRLRSVLIVSAIVSALCVPWVFLFAGMGQVVSGYEEKTFRLIYLLTSFVSQIGTYIFPPWLLAVPVLVVVWHWFQREKRPPADRKLRESVFLLTIFVAVLLAVLAVTAIKDFFRYLAPLIPVLCLLTALIIESCMRIHPAIGAAVFVLLLSRGQLPDYLYEITHDYDGPAEGIVEYLRENAGPNDIVATNHEDLPLKFYTNLRVISGTTGEDYSLAKDADWVIQRKYVCEGEHDITEYLVRHVPWSKYEAITILYPDTEFENREDPKAHMFRTAEGEELVVIWHRVRK